MLMELVPVEGANFNSKLDPKGRDQKSHEAGLIRADRHLADFSQGLRFGVKRLHHRVVGI